MSRLTIKKLLEKALLTVTPALPTEFENVDFTPPATGPYQSVNLVMGEPENRVYGNDFYEESGYLQVLLRYPTGEGEGAALLRAELLRAAFGRGLGLVENGVHVTVWRTPAIHQGFAAEGRWCVPVRVWVHVHVFL